MAIPKDPLKREFYVYRLCWESTPFYVGHGRDKRALDRVRYVKYLLTRQASGKPVKWNFSAAVVAEFLQQGHAVTVDYVSRDLTRAEAVEGEIADIRLLSARGLLLANYHHNPRRLRSTK